MSSSLKKLASCWLGRQASFKVVALVFSRGDQLSPFILTLCQTQWLFLLSPFVVVYCKLCPHTGTEGIPFSLIVLCKPLWELWELKSSKVALIWHLQTTGLSRSAIPYLYLLPSCSGCPQTASNSLSQLYYCQDRQNCTCTRASEVGSLLLKKKLSWTMLMLDIRNRSWTIGAFLCRDILL